MQPIRIYCAENSPRGDARAMAEAAGTDYAGRCGICLSQPLRLLKEASGRPLFNTPLLHVSISHSGAYWLAACSVRPLGIDLQLHVPCRCEAVARRFFHPDEYLWLKERNFTSFFDLWAAKESFAKYTGQGIASFRSFSLVEGRRIVEQKQNVYLRFIDFAADYALALSSEDNAAIMWQQL